MRGQDNMALTPDQVKRLTAPFAYTDHEFNPRGYVYISEEAISARLDEVDPSWEFVVTDMVRDLTSATVTGRLTVGGITREGVGTQGIEYVKANDQTAKTDAVGNPIEAGEVRKGAATDAFKRAARLFGIGRYLLGAPKQSDFKAWLMKIGNQPAPEPPRQRPVPSVERDAPEPPAANGWTIEQANSFNLERKRLNVTNEEVLNLLGVQSLREYAPGFSAADELLKKYAKSRPAQPAPIPDSVFGGAK
jgi:hypothetical protein